MKFALNRFLVYNSVALFHSTLHYSYFYGTERNRSRNNTQNLRSLQQDKTSSSTTKEIFDGFIRGRF
ncbi:MAG: hypothetical protein VKN72_11785 [Nostocales cyanobacterium 94392]|nr:hypothetical protein [Nostocales cyanobacterium 94392]